MSVVLSKDGGVVNGKTHPKDVKEHELEEITEDDATPVLTSKSILETVLSQLPKLSAEHLQELSSAVIARNCLQQQQENLARFVESFPFCADADFKVTQPQLYQSFINMVRGMKVTITEQALESTSSREGTLTVALPGLPDGANVTKTRDSFFVNEGATLLERSEVRVKLGGLDVYTGYWLATDTPSHNIEDPLQEEGIDTLRRVMEAAGIPLSSEVFEDPLEYPFLSALLAPFGPEAVAPFEEHLRSLHSEVGHRHGGCWFKMTSARKARSKLEQVTEDEATEGAIVLLFSVLKLSSLYFEWPTESVLEALPSERPVASRQQLTDAEEADLELEKLDL